MENNKAEVKPFKVGEALTNNVDGNTEPSISENSDRACVETRRGVCIKCSNVIINKPKNAKFCSDRCRNAFNSLKHRVKTGKIKCPGVGSGGNQFETDNHQYKHGKNTYHNKAFRKLPNMCNRCGSEEFLLVHHIDHNRDNNELYNLEILCKRCHQEHHCKRDSKGMYTKV
jgi:predicted nucleic acid-binding Zn ribbon protein